MGVFDGLLGAGASLLGGVLNTISGSNARDDAQAMSNEQMAQQRLFATTGLQWRAGDAMKAYAATGIHPLALLGVNAPSYSPVNYVGGGDNSMGDAVSNAGQSLARSIAATSDREGRDAMTTRFDALTTERMGLENELLRSRIASERMRLLSPGVGPPVPSNKWLVDGQGDGVNTELRSPLKGPVTVRPDGLAPHQEHGAVPSLGWIKNSDGSYAPVKSKDAQERLEDDFWGSTKHFVRNTVLPMFNPKAGRAPFPAPDGHHWYINGVGDWLLRRDKSQRLKGAGWRD